MSQIDSWHEQIGFSLGSPFASAAADGGEADLLEHYFVRHRAYNAVLNGGLWRSCILHAPRGAGKSATRLLFSKDVLGRFQHARPLLVELCNWNGVVEAAGDPDAVRLREHILPELLRQAVIALAEHEPPSAHISNHDLNQHLLWLCANYAPRAPGRRRGLERRGWLSATIRPHEDYALTDMKPEEQLAVLIDVIRALGFSGCYIVVDGVDETAGQIDRWQGWAQIIEQLLGDLQLLKVPALAFKCFLPSEIVALLQERRRIRFDRLDLHELTWSVDELAELLRSRLLYFSEGAIPGLAFIAEPMIRPYIDRRICELAQGSPRELIRLGHQLFLRCMHTASSDQPPIRAEHLQALVEAATKAPAAAPALAEQAPAQPQPIVRPAATPAAVALNVGTPRLVRRRDGRYYRGDEEIPQSDNLPMLQKRLLDYLYSNRNVLLDSERIIEHLRDGARIDMKLERDSLRKLVARLRDAIEIDPKNPVYIIYRKGGYYRLDNADPPEELPA